MNMPECVAFVSGIVVPNEIEGFFGRFRGQVGSFGNVLP